MQLLTGPTPANSAAAAAAVQEQLPQTAATPAAAAAAAPFSGVVNEGLLLSAAARWTPLGLSFDGYNIHQMLLAGRTLNRQQQQQQEAAATLMP